MCNTGTGREDKGSLICMPRPPSALGTASLRSTTAPVAHPTIPRHRLPGLYGVVVLRSTSSNIPYAAVDAGGQRYLAPRRHPGDLFNSLIYSIRCRPGCEPFFFSFPVFVLPFCLCQLCRVLSRPHRHRCRVAHLGIIRAWLGHKG